MKTHIIAVIDRSSSMSRIAAEASSGFNEFIRTQRKLPGQADVTLIEFSSSVDTLYRGVDIQRVQEYRIQPSGMTALLDGIGRGVEIGDEYARNYDTTMLAIVTDGDENQSRRYNQSQINQLISARQERGWNFVFLAANQDAFATARRYGIDDRYVANFGYDGAGAQSAMRSLNAMTTQIRGTTL